MLRFVPGRPDINQLYCIKVQLSPELQFLQNAVTSAPKNFWFSHLNILLHCVQESRWYIPRLSYTAKKNNLIERGEFERNRLALIPLGDVFTWLTLDGSFCILFENEFGSVGPCRCCQERLFKFSSTPAGVAGAAVVVVFSPPHTSLCQTL